MVPPFAEVRDGLEEGSEHGLSARSERAVQVYRRADERQVREGLREVAEGLPRVPDLLGVEFEVIGVGEHLFQGEARLVETSGPREALDEPERAQVEAALAAFQSVRGRVLRLVTVHERVVGEFVLDALEGGEPTRVRGADE